MIARILTLSPLMVATFLFTGPLSAQQAHNASTTSPHKTIAFRLPEWKSVQFQDAAGADQAEQALKEIGCEVNRFAQNGRTEIQYRCQTWKQIHVDSLDRINQWNQWLIKKGMWTMVADPDPNMKASRVRYQLAGTRTVHARDVQEADYTQGILELLGCQVTRHTREGRIELEYTCPQWQTIGCNNCPTAHGWQDWLRDQGFETQHSH